MKRIGLLLVMAFCLAFALPTLLLIDATALWSDEFYSVGKSFQFNCMGIFTMLREDTHPLAYYLRHARLLPCRSEAMGRSE